jgi:hypothetical protein
VTILAVLLVQYFVPLVRERKKQKADAVPRSEREYAIFLHQYLNREEFSAICPLIFSFRSDSKEDLDLFS